MELKRGNEYLHKLKSMKINFGQCFYCTQKFKRQNPEGSMNLL